MRINRLVKYKRRRKYKSNLSWMFYIILPVLAMAVALFMSGTFKNSSVDNLKNQDNNQSVVNTFNQVFNLEEKRFYRIELASFEDKPSADKFVNSLKASKLNAFIVNEDGFKVIYGIFYNNENAAEIGALLSEKKKENVINIIRLSGVSFKYGDEDKKFVELVKASDELMDKILESKSQLSKDYAQKTYDGYETKFDEVLADESKLGKYLEDVKQAQVTENLRIFREQYIKLLMDFQGSGIQNTMDLKKTGSKLETEKKDYYKLQKSILLQVKSYRDFIERLSV